MVKSCFNNNCETDVKSVITTETNTTNDTINAKNIIPKIKSESNKSKKGKMLRNIVQAPIKFIKAGLSTSIQYKRKKLPFGLRSNVWTKYNGEVFNAKCYVDFCNQNLTPFTFEVGHDIPVSKGGSNSISNLRPICRNCNLSMSNKYTIEEYSNTFK